LNILFYAQVGGILQESGGIGLIKKTGKIATIILYLDVAIVATYTHARTHTHIHTHTHTRAFDGPLSGLPGWASTRKVNQAGFQ